MKVNTSSEIDQHPGASQITTPTKRRGWYKKQYKDSISPTSSPKLHHAPPVTDDRPLNPRSRPPTSRSPTNTSLQAAQLAPPGPSTSKGPSPNVLSLNGIGGSLNTVNSFKRTRVASIPNPVAMEPTPRLSAIPLDGPTGPPSPTAQPGRSGFRLALLHRHTTDTVTTTTVSGGRGSGRSVAFSGVPLTLSQLAIGGGTTASEKERLNQSQVRGPHAIPSPMSPIASVSSIGMPATSPFLVAESNVFGADPLNPPPSPKGKAKDDPIILPRASTPASGSCSPGLLEIVPGASPRQGDGDGDGSQSRRRTPRRSKRNAPISYSEARALAHEIGASAYIECSALTLVNVVAVFEEAVKVAGESSKHNSYFG